MGMGVGGVGVSVKARFTRRSAQVLILGSCAAPKYQQCGEVAIPARSGSRQVARLGCMLDMQPRQAAQGRW